MYAVPMSESADTAAPVSPLSAERPFYGIVALDANRVMGKDNYLPWKIREDLRWFRRTTTGNTLVLGRMTWEGILAANGQDFVFRNRHVVVLTRNPAQSAHTWPGANDVCD